MISLNIHGVINIEGVGISDKELISHAFINSIAKHNQTDEQADITERYAY